MIDTTALAALNETRVYDIYRMRDSWINLLEHSVLNKNGHIDINWQTNLRLLMSKWRYNEIIADMTNKNAFEFYDGDLKTYNF